MALAFRTTAPGVVALSADGRPDIECLMTPLEPVVYDTACDALPNAARAAEVGCFKGGSACLLWHGMHRRGKALVLACHDLFEPFDLNGATVDVEAAFDANRAAWGFDAVKVKGDSKSTHRVHLDASLDYVFVDGDHTYEGAAADIANFLPKVKRDGFFVLQDTVLDVRRAAREALARLPHFVVVPPFGHFVTVVCRDERRLDELRSRLVAAMENVGAGTLGPDGGIRRMALLDLETLETEAR